MAFCANGVYNPAFLHSTPGSKQSHSSLDNLRLLTNLTFGIHSGGGGGTRECPKSLHGKCSEWICCTNGQECQKRAGCHAAAAITGLPLVRDLIQPAVHYTAAGHWRIVRCRVMTAPPHPADFCVVLYQSSIRCVY